MLFLNEERSFSILLVEVFDVEVEVLLLVKHHLKPQQAVVGEATYADARTSSGQMTVKCRPEAGRAYDFDSAPEQLDQSLGDGQSSAPCRRCGAGLSEMLTCRNSSKMSGTCSSSIREILSQQCP